MQQKIVIFGLLVAWYLSRYTYLRLRGQPTRHLLLSFVLTTIPFQIAVPLLTPAYQTMAGTFSAKLFLTIPAAAVLYGLLRAPRSRVFYVSRHERWVSAVAVLLLISGCNPHNYAPWATVALAGLFVACILFARLVARQLTPPEILAGFYESFVFLCGLQAVLAVCFPLLGLKVVTQLFQVGGEEWSTRHGSRPGAVGVFVHPGNLALFTMLASCFFQACYLTGLHRKRSLTLLLLNAATIILTYSRTSYLTVVLAQVAIYYLYRNAHRPLLSLQAVLWGGCPRCCCCTG